VPAEKLRGRTLVIDFDGMSTGDQVWVPGEGRMATAYASMLGAETLTLGTPRDLGFLPPFLVALLLSALSLGTSSRRGEVWPIATGFLSLLILPVGLEANLFFVDVFAGLAVLTTVAVRLAYRRWRSGGLVNADTGLLNLTALREARLAPDQLLVAARIHNYAEIVSTLSDKSQAELVRQIVQRLAVADSPLTVYQGDEGIFAWFTDSSAALPDHLEALHSFFRTPVSMGRRAIDVALTFGVEMGSRRSNATRLGSALVAADEAWVEGLRWKYHDPSREEEVSWRLSLLGELDAAIDKGEVWVAFQPQYDLRSNRIIGAEALARWTHPEKGPISPAEFVAAAEQQGRIAKLTDFVLDRAISTAAAINRRGTPFTIAVNISPRLLNDPDLVSRVRQSVRKHQLPAERLTLELTETETLQGADGGLSILESLRALGVRIAIDDYGTGLSTLEYLKKIPASEIKIDQSFIKAMKVNRSDLIMVQSTIALAHSLGRTVVAEGVEDRATLQQLEHMGCDVVQGYVIGRPMGLRELMQGMYGRSTRHVA
jgi:EAL domain-containing protein (putative c-di-GMP-specific phosphodiesterase class I)